MNTSYLKELLHYDGDTGCFTWKISRSHKIKIGDVAGYIHTHDGYRYINIDYKMYKAHRLVWLYFHDEFPRDFIDHINGCRSDNRISNLRKCSHSENMCNRGKTIRNTSGYKGVHYHAQSGKWRACAIKDGKKHSFGLYYTPEEAHAAHVKYCKIIHGEFAHVA